MCKWETSPLAHSSQDVSQVEWREVRHRFNLRWLVAFLSLFIIAPWVWSVCRPQRSFVEHLVRSTSSAWTATRESFCFISVEFTLDCSFLLVHHLGIYTQHHARAAGWSSCVTRSVSRARKVSESSRMPNGAGTILETVFRRWWTNGAAKILFTRLLSEKRNDERDIKLVVVY